MQSYGGETLYINTATKETMEASIYKILGITNTQLEELFHNCYKRYQENQRVFILDDLYDYLKSYVETHMKQSLDEVIFYHFSRRLNNEEDDYGYNLAHVLTKDTSLSRILNTYGITFQYDKQKLHMYVNQCEIDFDQSTDYPYIYLKQRFDKDFKDFSIGGFVFMEEIEYSSFYEIASGGPEFFGYLYEFLEDDDALIDEFINLSSFYRFEYVVPLKDIYFDDYEDLNALEKQCHMIVKTLQRLYFYKYDAQFNEDDNMVIKMVDQKDLSDAYLVHKIKL